MKILSLKNAVPMSLLALGLAGCGGQMYTQPAPPPAPTPAPAVPAAPAPRAGQMSLSIAGSASLNPDPGGMPQPVVLRVYQLRNTQAFETATYAQLLAGDSALQPDLVSRAEVTLAPGATLSLSEPMQTGARYVGVVAFFQNQDDAEWQIAIPRSQWRRANPVRLTVDGNRLELDAGGARAGSAQ